MPRFGVRSQAHLVTCHPLLQQVFHEVIRWRDCSILEGKRSVSQQEENVRRGVSKTMNSHHVYPIDKASKAVDVVPYPIDWENRERMIHFGGYVLGVARANGIHLRWGGDWNEDGDTTDHSFSDLPHFELVDDTVG